MNMVIDDGRPVRYAMGFINDSLSDHHVISHDGGINGCLTDMVFPG
jgi:hypothetical protein